MSRRASISQDSIAKFGKRRSSVSKRLPSLSQEKSLPGDIPEEGQMPDVARPALLLERSSLTRYSRYLIQLPSEKCTVVFYHQLANITYREVVEAIQAALVAAYRPPNSIVNVELVPLMSRCPEYYAENRWVIQMIDEELASLMYRSDVYIRTRKVNVMSLQQALSLEKSREFRDQLRIRMQKMGANRGAPLPLAVPLNPQQGQGRRMSRVNKLFDFYEDPKTAVQQQPHQ